jgi:cell division septation protein DedD
MESRSGRIRGVRAGILVAIASMVPLSAVASQFPLGVIAPPVLINVPPPVSSGNPLPMVPVPANPGSLKRPKALPVSRGIQRPTERVYTAPQMNPFQSPSQLGTGQYRVIVENSSPSVLRQVRSIQPDAFAQTVEGRRSIQAGVFNTEDRARQQVEQLADQGINARVTTQPGQAVSTRNSDGSAPGESLTASSESNYGGSYYVIVPGSRSKLPIYYSRTIQLGYAQSLVQVRDEARGAYLSVGPFSNRRQAERVSGELRARGNLDARVLYDR